MANFIPLKRHLLRCLRAAIRMYRLQPPFLDVGCGQGDVSVWLARRGWAGTAVDFSPTAVRRARQAMQPFSDVKVLQEELADVSGTFRTVIAWDVLEHIDDDASALRIMAQRTEPGGHLVLSVPSNPSEWRWDDEFYGHVRRYTPRDITRRLNDAGFDVDAMWDSTFPVFWLMRRIFTRLKRPVATTGTKSQQTKASSGTSAWSIPILGTLVDRSWPLWEPVSFLQFHLFRRMVHRGHELFIVARRRT